MKQIIIAILFLISGTISLASTCDKFPKEGPVSVPLVLADGTHITFKAVLKIKHYNSLKERVITHVYKYPTAFVGKKEVAISALGLDGIAQGMGYDGLGFRELAVNSGILRKRKVLTTKNDVLTLMSASSKAHYIISPRGFGIFHHRKCAPWMFN